MLPEFLEYYNLCITMFKFSQKIPSKSFHYRPNPWIDREITLQYHQSTISIKNFCFFSHAVVDIGILAACCNYSFSFEGGCIWTGEK